MIDELWGGYRNRDDVLGTPGARRQPPAARRHPNKQLGAHRLGNDLEHEHTSTWHSDKRDRYRRYPWILKYPCEHQYGEDLLCW
jgi:hypothetical protein